jgi:RNA polymerase sigma-70 factor (sigma-E family)
VDSGAEARFREWAATRSPALHRFAYLLCGDFHVAQDLAQEALTKAALHWNRVETAEHPDAYVRRIVINEFHSLRRRRSWPVVGRRSSAEVGVTDHVVEYVSRDALMAALRVLTPRQRTVVVLRYYEQLSEVETAVALGCSVGTVKSQTHKALQAMRRTMTTEDHHVHR